MPTFKRLKRSDLDTLTRTELQDRIEAENAYWDRKCRRGLSEADAAAHQEFSVILHAAIDPGASLAHAQHYLETGVDNGYWDEKPGAPRDMPWPPTASVHTAAPTDVAARSTRHLSSTGLRATTTPAKTRTASTRRVSSRSNRHPSVKPCSTLRRS